MVTGFWRSGAGAWADGVTAQPAGPTCIAFYLFGAESERRGISPVPQLISLRNKVLPTKVRPESGYTLDAQDRLIGDAEKPAVACPKQTDRTAVLLVLGQSNAGRRDREPDVAAAEDNCRRRIMPSR